MQSSQGASVAISSQEPAYMDSIAYRTRSRKRTHSEMTGDTKDIGEFTYDILECFPILLCQYVFQHFSGKELLKMSTVNREWNKLVGEKKQMGKLRLRIGRNSDKQTRKIKNVLMNSQRRYQNIWISIDNNNLELSLSLLAKGAGLWKSVSIAACRSLPQDIWPRVLQIVEPTVEKLLLLDEWWHLPGELSNVATSFTFPHLKDLTCDVCDNYSLFRHFDRVTSLVNFTCDMPETGTEEAFLDLCAILRNNRKLKELDISGEARFLEQLSGIKFKLQKLRINRREVDIPDPELIHFHSFLKTQAETLESFVTVLPVDQALLEIVLGMSRLAKLQMSSISGEIQELPVNSSIASFKVDQRITASEGVRSGERISYQKLIGAMRSLKNFKCKQIDAELLFVLQDLDELESIQTSFFNVLRVPERNAFPNLKKFTVFVFHVQMQEPTSDDNFAKLVRRGMRANDERGDSDSGDLDFWYWD